MFFKEYYKVYGYHTVKNEEVNIVDLTKSFFSTGDFSNICGVKKQTLYHYDDVGLLKPEYKNDNGYRFYSIQQTEVFFVIEMLKDTGMSLAEIKDFLHTKNPQETIDLLKEKELLLQDKITKMIQTKEIIQNKRRQIKEALTLNFDHFEIKKFNKKQYVLSKNILNSTDKEYTKAVMSFIKFTKREVLDKGFPVGGLLRKEQLDEGNYWNYQNLYMQVDHPNLEEPFIKKAGNYVVGYHKGSYLNIGNTYENIKRYLAQQGYYISGDSFEEYVMDEVSVSGEDNYVTRIMIQVRKK